MIEFNIVNTINIILNRNGIGKIVKLEDLTITEDTVSDLVKSNSILSDIIIDNIWPSISHEEVFHFTSSQAAESILMTNKFRLTNIEKRYKDNEIKTFCEAHNLKGYLELDAQGNPKYKSLIMPNTYYASFASEQISSVEEDYLWSSFASGDGVRFKLKITASNPNFRKIVYKQGKDPIALLNDLTETIRDTYKREFILKGISRLCSFFLGEDYKIENERRILYRDWGMLKTKPILNNGISYIEIPLNTMSEIGYKIEILEVCSRVKPSNIGSVIFKQRV